MQTMRDPQLLPCGHISDLEPIIKTWKCPFVSFLSFIPRVDSEMVTKEELITINPSISYLYKGTIIQFIKVR